MMFVVTERQGMSWSYISARTPCEIYLKLPVHPKTAVGIRQRKKRTEIAKPFVLHANAKGMFTENS